MHAIGLHTMAALYFAMDVCPAHGARL